MGENQKLHSTKEWEDKKPSSVEYERILYTRNGQVRLVKGTIEIVRKRTEPYDTHYENAYRKARWDGYGYCYVGTHNKRSRDYDIPFNG